MRPPIAEILAGEMLRAVANSECGQPHPETHDPCVLRHNHGGKHKTWVSRRWERKS